MLGWLKKLIGAAFGAEARELSLPVRSLAAPRLDPKAGRTVMEVVDTFLLQNPKPTPFGTHALIAAGAAELRDAHEVLAACEKIAAHGYAYPLSPTLGSVLVREELLAFLRWQAAAAIPQAEYAQEPSIRRLIARFRAEGS
jgi:hypothetical protein